MEVPELFIEVIVIGINAKTIDITTYNSCKTNLGSVVKPVNQYCNSYISQNVNITGNILLNYYSFVSSNRILPFVYTLSGIFVELLKVIQSAGICK